MTTHGGQRFTGMDVVEWAKRAVELGASELVLNSIDADGTGDGYDNSSTGRWPKRSMCL